MNNVRITTVVGARPQFIKAATVSRAITAFNAASGGVRIEERLVHTGQHYDENMSQVFFDQLHIPRPAVNLGVGSGPHGQQTGRIMEKLEAVLQSDRPQWVLVYGDTNSTLAGALAAAKLHLPLAHVEAGLRSYNHRMPEEINRIVTDVLAEALFCPTDQAVKNLAREGITRGIYQVGDVMYDSVLFHARLARQTSDVLDRMGLRPKSYYLATVHRAENVDDPARLGQILEAFRRIAQPIILLLHPRMRKVLGSDPSGLPAHLRLADPVPYLDMLVLEQDARLILTDSGGVQKEAYWLGTPCVTLRNETEWTELVTAGCNRIGGTDPATILSAVQAFEDAGAALPEDQPRDLYGDGHSAEKIVAVLASMAGR